MIFTVKSHLLLCSALRIERNIFAAVFIEALAYRLRHFRKNDKCVFIYAAHYGFQPVYLIFLDNADYGTSFLLRIPALAFKQGYSALQLCRNSLGYLIVFSRKMSARRAFSNPLTVISSTVVKRKTATAE